MNIIVVYLGYANSFFFSSSFRYSKDRSCTIKLKKKSVVVICAHFKLILLVKQLICSNLVFISTKSFFVIFIRITFSDLPALNLTICGFSLCKKKKNAVQRKGQPVLNYKAEPCSEQNHLVVEIFIKFNLLKIMLDVLTFFFFFLS